MSIDQRRKYDSDFKRQAVRLTEDPGRSVAKVAESLGIAKDLLYRWRREHIPQEGLAFFWEWQRGVNLSEKGNTGT